MTRRALAVAAIFAAVSITACSNTTQDEAPVDLDLTGQDAFASPTGSPAENADDQASAAAAAKIEEFTAVLAKVETDPAVDVNALDTVSAGAILDQVKANVVLRRSQGIVSTGGITVARWTVSKLAVPQDQDGRPTPGIATVDLRVCFDVSGYESERPDGTSVLDPDHPAQELGLPTVTNPIWPDPNGWRITADAVQRSGLPCDPS